MDQTVYFDGQDVLKDDLEFDDAATQLAIEDRSQDAYSIGGFIFPGGVVSPNGGFPGTKVDISAGTVYDSRGRRVEFGTQSALPLINIVGGNNFVLVSIPNFTDTPVQHPIDGTSHDTRLHDVAAFTVKATFVQGDTDGGGNPYVPIALVTSDGVTEVITDLRLDLLAIKPNSVDTDELVNNAVTFAKLATYARPLFWSDEPGIFFDKDTNTLRAQNPAGTFFLAGNFNFNTLTGIPLLINPPPSAGSAVVIWGTTGVGVCTVQSTPIGLGGFNPNTFSKTNGVILGIVTRDNIFVPIQALIEGEITQLSEEQYNGTTSRIKANENMWRRFNEGFQSFTPNSLDGTLVAVPNPMNLLSIIGGPSLQVALGTSFVAGRRLVQPGNVTLTNVNTKNYATMVGTAKFDIYILRDIDIPVTNVFRYSALPIGSTAPSNGYLIGTLTVTGGVFTSILDRRVFTPVREAAAIVGASQNTKTGCGLINTTAFADAPVKIAVQPGSIGFADGTVRTNTVQKILDFSQTFDPAVATNSLPTGALQTKQGGSPTGLEPFSHYAIFATADHTDLNDFNLVAVKVSFFRSVNGAPGAPGQYQYTMTAPGNFPINRSFYVGQRIRATRADYTGPQNNAIGNSAPGLGQFTNDNSSGGEKVVSIIGNVVTVSLGGNTALAGFAGGTLTALDKFRPDIVLTGISKRYRLLGFVSTDGVAVPNTSLRIFSLEEGHVSFSDGGLLNKMPASGFTTQGWNLDMANLAPVCAKIHKVSVSIEMLYPAGGNTDITSLSLGITEPNGQHFSTVAIIGNNATGGIGAWAGRNDGCVWAETKAYMGFVGVSLNDTFAFQIYGSIFYGMGYIFDVKNEWSLQTFVAGVGGFIP